jgi:peptide/nickel transport system substrate-binding protein
MPRSQNNYSIKNISNIERNTNYPPKISWWSRVFHILNLKEKILLFFLLFIFFGSALSWGGFYYFSKTQAISNYGGEYIEGIVGQPRHINPLLSGTNETDADLTRIVYSGMLKHNGKGEIVPDLAERYEISEDKTTYTVHLKKNVTWHDDQPMTTNDIAFTISLASASTFLKNNWRGIETRVIDDHTIEFKIASPYVGFLNNLTFGILPKHIWQSISPENISLSALNLKPVGTGPYKYSSVQKDSNDNIISYKLIANPNYFEGKPFISKITFNFYTDEDSALKALNHKEIMGISALSPEKINNIKAQKSISVYSFKIPRYFAVFFNQTKSIPVASDEVREALSYATNREEIIEKVLNKFGKAAHSPFLPGMIGFDESVAKKDFNLEKANSILDENGWTRGDDGVRQKDRKPLEIKLTTADLEDLLETAEVLREQWKEIGVKLNVEAFSMSDIRENHMRPREYEAFLFGQIIGLSADPYSFWHSNEKKDPGLNLALFDDSEADQFIEMGRVEFDTEKRNQAYIDFQKILARENPAVFLYTPSYVYPVNKKVKGLEIETLLSPYGRFSDINHWYIKTKRVKK